MHLLDAGWHVVVAGRSAPKFDDQELSRGPHLHRNASMDFLPLDLADLDFVQDCAKGFLSLGLPLDALVLNAGVAGMRGQTEQGFELAFGLNHLGHFLLTQLLLEKLRQSAPSRVVTVASRAHYFAQHGIDWYKVRKASQSWFGVRDYGASKLANIWFSRVLARQLASDNVSCYSLHPGVVKTGIWRYAPVWFKPVLGVRSMLTPVQGAMTSLHCILHAPQHETGLYYANCRPVLPSAMGRNEEEAEKLWVNSMEFCAKWL